MLSEKLYSTLSPLLDTFDLLLTRNLTRGHILDFNPYAPRTDPILFTYEELAEILGARLASQQTTPEADDLGITVDVGPSLPEFRVIDSRAHPAAISNAPIYQHNMVPYEALSLSSGRDIEEFAGSWDAHIRESTKP